MITSLYQDAKLGCNKILV